MDSLNANFQSFSRIIVKMAKLGLSLLNRLQYIPICKILPNDRRMNTPDFAWRVSSLSSETIAVLLRAGSVAKQK